MGLLELVRDREKKEEEEEEVSAVMAEFLTDPSVLTKDKLKSALVANNVALPNGEQRKGVYVELYLKNLTSQNKRSGSAEAFSSDEEPPAPAASITAARSGRKATRKTDRVRPEEVDVTELTDEDLKEQLLKYGVSAGPIVASTRKVYEKKLQKLLDQGPPQTTIFTLSESVLIHNSRNGTADSDQYSDKEEETATAVEPELEPEPELVPVLERPLRSRGKTPVTIRNRSSQNKPKASGEEVELSVFNTALLEVGPHEVLSSGPGHVERSGGSAAVAQSRIHGFFSPVTPVRGQDDSLRDQTAGRLIEKLSAVEQTPKTVESDVLKELFPYEVFNTPTGISATRRQPIKGAAGRPFSDAWKDTPRPRLSEHRYTSSSYTESRSVPRVSAVPLSVPKPSAPQSLQADARRRVPVWVQLLLLAGVAGILLFIYQSMESNQMSPFGQPARSGELEDTGK
ncbi:thymopoietin a isoform X4 [Ictalurus punctatus]|uniref:Thymopoietin a isoform X4 n=1 Tax=Ictalurus punctatus TaxID=7998 RepID=A0A979FDE1_ICTPU|nr:thymopoietin a isoform X4 [Ictalurus punctatus]